MSLKDTWRDRVNDVDENSADDINELAHAIIANEDGVAKAKESAEKSANVNISAEQTETGAIITVTDRDGVQTSVNIDNNEDKINLLSHELTQRSNPLKGSASGEIISMDDVSPVEHEMNVKASSKNLLDIDSMLNDVLTKNDDEYTLARIDSGWNGRVSKTVNIFIPANTPITLSVGKLTFNGVGYYALAVSIKFDDESTSGQLSIPNGRTSASKTFDKNVISIMLYVDGNEAIGTPITTFTKPQLEIGSTATEYTPYVNITQAKLLKQNANLWNPNNFYRGYGTINPDGSLTVETGFEYQNMVDLNGKLRSGTYTVSNISGKRLYVMLQSGDYSKFCDVGNTLTFAYDGVSFLRFVCGSQSANTSFTYKIMLNEGESALPYELYFAPTEYPILADGTVEGVTSLYPTTTLYADTAGVLINAEYNRDINKAFKALEEKITALSVAMI